jgi:glutathione S-transferase
MNRDAAGMTTSQNNGAPEFVLCWMPGTCARMPMVALEEIGVPYELRIINKFAQDHLTPEYVALNPKGRVPTLLVHGRPLSENPAILAYLARRFPEAKLLPIGDLDLEIDALSTMCWFASSLHPNVSRHRFPRFYSTLQREDCMDGIRMAARHELELLFGILEQRLEGREWLYEQWSIVDAYLLWVWFRAIGAGMKAEPFPRLIDHARRCEQRPSVARALDKEEEVYARHEREGAILPATPPHHVGRASVLVG